MNRLTLVIAGTVMLSACIAAIFPCTAFAFSDSPSGSTWVGSTAPGRAADFIARQDAAVDSVNTSEKDTGPDPQNESETDSETTPDHSESDNLNNFTPSEKIDADQGVDFPYNI